MRDDQSPIEVMRKKGCVSCCTLPSVLGGLTILLASCIFASCISSKGLSRVLSSWLIEKPVRPGVRQLA